MNVTDPQLKKFIKVKKLKKAKLSKSEQSILNINNTDEFTNIVTQEIKYKIQEIEDKIAQVSDDTAEQSKIKRKNWINKLKFLRKVLRTPEELNKRVKMLKTQRRKLKRKEKKFEEIQDKLKKMKLKCLFCKKKGHVVAECKEKIASEKGIKEPQTKAPIKPSNICFNCGKDDHNIYGCNLPVDMKNLPFADCFVCKSKGHLSSHCPQSDKGIYIKGGSCFNCGSKEHLAKNCPTKQLFIPQKEEESKHANRSYKENDRKRVFKDRKTK